MDVASVEDDAVLGHGPRRLVPRVDDGGRHGLILRTPGGTLGSVPTAARQPVAFR